MKLDYYKIISLIALLLLMVYFLSYVQFNRYEYKGTPEELIRIEKFSGDVEHYIEDLEHDINWVNYRKIIMEIRKKNK